MTLRLNFDERLRLALQKKLKFDRRINIPNVKKRVKTLHEKTDFDAVLLGHLWIDGGMKDFTIPLILSKIPTWLDKNVPHDELVFWTENHSIGFFTIGHVFKNEDPTRLIYWLESRATFGFCELNSSAYSMVTLEALCVLVRGTFNMRIQSLAMRCIKRLLEGVMKCTPPSGASHHHAQMRAPNYKTSCGQNISGVQFLLTGNPDFKELEHFRALSFLVSNNILISLAREVAETRLHLLRTTELNVKPLSFEFPDAFTEFDRIVFKFMNGDFREWDKVINEYKLHTHKHFKKYRIMLKCLSLAGPLINQISTRTPAVIKYYRSNTSQLSFISPFKQGTDHRIFALDIQGVLILYEGTNLDITSLSANEFDIKFKGFGKFYIVNSDERFHKGRKGVANVMNACFILKGYGALMRIQKQEIKVIGWGSIIVVIQ